MGAGIVSILLHNLPYNAVWLYWISIVFFRSEHSSFRHFHLHLYNTVYDVSRDLGGYDSAPHAVSIPRNHSHGLCNHSQYGGLCLCVMLGSMGDHLCLDSAVDRCCYLRRYMLLSAVRNVRTSFSVSTFPFGMIRYHQPLEINMRSNSMRIHSQTPLSTMTAAWLLPVVPTIVAAASGGIVAEVLPNRQRALWTITMSYILWGTGVPLAMATLVIYFERLTLYKLPPREVIVSCFLPLGPLGQGGFAIMRFSRCFNYVGIWTCMVLLRSCVYQSIQISVQHGLVGLYISSWCIRGFDHYIG